MNRRWQLRLAMVTGLSLLGVGLVGCSSSSDAASPSGPTNLGWAESSNVDAILTGSCASCHDSQWSSCWDDQAVASELQGVIASGEMPEGKPLPAADKASLLEWLDAGAPCSGDKPSVPDENGGTGGTGTGSPSVRPTG